MSFILNIETSTEICSVSLSKDGKLMDTMESADGQNHARLVTVFAETLFERNKIKLTELNAVAVSKGPGSYTGLRIGVSAAKGICYALSIPLIAVGTLESMAHYVTNNMTQLGIKIEKEPLFCPMIDARRMEVFSMLLDKDEKIVKPITAIIIDHAFLSDELKQKQVVFFGNGSEKCKAVISSPNALFIDNIHASSAYICDLATQAYNNKQFEDVAYFEPFYLKDFVATVSKKNMPG